MEEFQGQDASPNIVGDGGTFLGRVDRASASVPTDQRPRQRDRGRHTGQDALAVWELGPW